MPSSGRPRPRPRPAAARSAACRSARSIARCSNNIPDWLKLTAEGRLEEAYEISAATNTMPEICGRICPQDRLCEGNCVIEQSGHGTVTIGAVEKYITDTAWEKGWVKPLKPRARARPDRSASSAPGPAGLAAAEQLRRKGYQVHCLRPLRPHRRAADLRHSELQAGEGGRRAPHQAADRRRHRSSS